MIGIVVGNSGRMHGKMRALYNVITKRFKGMGTVAKQNSNAMVLTLKNGLRAVITMDKDNVAAYWGDLKPVNEIDISNIRTLKKRMICHLCLMVILTICSQTISK